MKKTILGKEVQVIGNEVIITENVETRMDRAQLELKLRDIYMQKLRIKEQNNRLLVDYDVLLQEEVELNSLVNQLGTDGGVIEI